jgi:hypothetical protein
VSFAGDFKRHNNVVNQHLVPKLLTDIGVLDRLNTGRPKCAVSAQALAVDTEKLPGI